MNNDNEATNVLEKLVALELKDWSGLPAGTLLKHAGEVFEVEEDWRGTGSLGSECRKTDWYAVAAERFVQGLRLWVRDGQLILIDAPLPDLPIELDELLDALGPPLKRLDSYLGTLLIENSEWVYPQRGLTLFVNPGNRRLLRIAVFQPVGIEAYRSTLRLNLQRVRLPLAGQIQAGDHQ